MGFDQASRGPARFRIAAVTAMPHEAFTRADVRRRQGNVDLYSGPPSTGGLAWSCGTDTRTSPEQVAWYGERNALGKRQDFSQPVR